MSTVSNIKLDAYQRQIHLDFHTSPFIEDVGKDFDIQSFVEVLQQAHVNSINIFAKCHHGMCYYPTKTGIQHPALDGKNLFGEMLAGLKSAGIRTTAYTTIVWEEDVANRFPAWRQMKKDGTFADLETSADGITKQPAGWKFNNFLHPEYQDYFEAHLKELFEYDIDGLWLDILFLHPQGGWSEESIKFREKHGLLADTLENQMRMESLAQGSFAERFTDFINAHKPGMSIFYNTPNNRYVIGEEGISRKSYYQTHYEIESLPTGFWGYHHFPRVARHLAHKGKEWLSMTGKFQKMWGDFGGIKPQAALEYETFRAQAMGGAVCVGDQLHPNGVLDPATYDLIGAVYEQVEEAEPYYQGVEIVKEIGVITPNYPGKDEHQTGLSEEGAMILLDSLHYQVAVLDDESEFAGYKLIILPDAVIVTDKLKEKLDAYQQAGGKLLISHQSLFDAKGNEALSFLPLSYHGVNDMQPTYWRTGDKFVGKQFAGERVVYNQGLKISSDSLEVLVDRVHPYFKRSDLKYCSHFQAPPIPESKEPYPAVVGNEQFVYFAEPIFREYREAGNYFVKLCFATIVEQLIGKPQFGFGMSPDVLATALRKDNDLILTLLNYIPVKKAVDQEVIEYANTLYGQEVHLTGYEGNLRSLLDGVELTTGGEGYKIHDVKGRVILQAEGFFKEK